MKVIKAPLIRSWLDENYDKQKDEEILAELKKLHPKAEFKLSDVCQNKSMWKRSKGKNKVEVVVEKKKTIKDDFTPNDLKKLVSFVKIHKGRENTLGLFQLWKELQA